MGIRLKGLDIFKLKNNRLESEQCNPCFQIYNMFCGRRICFIWGFWRQNRDKGEPLWKMSFLWMLNYLLCSSLHKYLLNDKYVTGSAAKECLVYCWRQVYTSIKLGGNPNHGITRWCRSSEEIGMGEEQKVGDELQSRTQVFWLLAVHLIIVMEMSTTTIHSVTQAHGLRAHSNLTLSLICKPKPSQPLSSISLGTKHFSKRSLCSCYYNWVSTLRSLAWIIWQHLIARLPPDLALSSLTSRGP